MKKQIFHGSKKIKRVITVILEVEDAEAAKTLWKSHLDGELLVGCKVQSIANGNFIKILHAVDKVMDNEHETRDVNGFIGLIDEAIKNSRGE